MWPVVLLMLLHRAAAQESTLHWISDSLLFDGHWLPGTASAADQPIRWPANAAEIVPGVLVGRVRRVQSDGDLSLVPMYIDTRRVYLARSDDASVEVFVPNGGYYALSRSSPAQNPALQPLSWTYIDGRGPKKVTPCVARDGIGYLEYNRQAPQCIVHHKHVTSGLVTAPYELLYSRVNPAYKAPELTAPQLAAAGIVASATLLLVLSVVSKSFLMLLWAPLTLIYPLVGLTVAGLVIWYAMMSSAEQASEPCLHRSTYVQWSGGVYQKRCHSCNASLGRPY